MRLAKEQKLSGEVTKLDKKLSNPGFLSKAAPEIIEKDRAKLADAKDQLAHIEAQQNLDSCEVFRRLAA